MPAQAASSATWQMKPVDLAIGGMTLEGMALPILVTPAGPRADGHPNYHADFRRIELVELTVKWLARSKAL
jgi:hypothetical protein